MKNHELVRWAIKTIEELDEVGRSMIAGFDPMSSEEVGKLKKLKKLAERLESND